MTVEVIRTDGTRETVTIARPHRAIVEIATLIEAETLDTVNLRDGRVMLVDDTGMIDGRPINDEATRLYWTVRPGTFNSIFGDVVIATDADFA